MASLAVGAAVLGRPAWKTFNSLELFTELERLGVKGNY
jgi:hypothetical protein